MSALASEYCDQLKDQFKVLYGAFPPNNPVDLGDFGVLNGTIFVRLGNLVTRYGLDPKLVKEFAGTPGDFNFTSEGSVDVEFRAKGDTSPSGVPVKAGLDIAFSKQYSVFFNAAGCTPILVEDQVELSTQVMTLYREQKWDKNFVLVTTVMRAKNTTIAVSSSSKANISLDASSKKIAGIDLADATLGLSVKRISNIGLKTVTQAGLTPLLGLSKIQGGPFSEKKVSPMSAPAMIDMQKRTAEPPEFFGAMLD